MGLMDILNQALSGHAAAEQHFDQVAHHAPDAAVSSGLAEAFRSDQTPNIGNMVSQLFGKSNGQQQAGMLNQILASLGPVAAAALAGGVLSKVMAPGSKQITPAQASQLSPEQVQDVVKQAHDQNPAVADQLASFYAQHSGLIKTLGGAALVVALAKMKQHLSEN